MSDATFEKYEHHGRNVWVNSALRGKGWEHCLCGHCKKLKIADKERNCATASALYALCVKHGLVTPVYECPDFERKAE